MANYYDDGTSWGSGLDWDMTSNQGLTPLVNYNFTLQVEGIYNLPCKSVHVFHRENEYETLQEGGLNDYVHMLRKPISKPLTFQVERYVGIDMLDPLALGTELILPVLLQVSRYSGDGEVLDLSDSMQRVYTFTGCTVIAKDFGELNAERSGLLVETTTIAYREMVCVDNPSTTSKRKTWSMKKDHANMERDAEVKATKLATYGINELAKKDLEAKAHMYVDKDVKDIPDYILNYKGESVKKIKISDARGIATTNEMAPISEREKAAKRFFMPGSKSVAGYKGSKGNSATVNKDELGREEMEKLARQGGANKPIMKAVEPRKGGAEKKEMSSAKNQRKYFIEGSKSQKDYKGTVKSSATVLTDEKRKDELEAAARKGGAVKPEMKAVKPRKGGAEIKKMSPAENQRRYFIEGSKSQKDYTGKVKTSATVLTDEKRKSELEAAARKGGAEIKQMSPTKDQRRYFIEGSTSKENYTGTVKNSAAVLENEKRKSDLEAAARKGGAIKPEMKAVEPRQGGATKPEMKRVEPRQGGAEKPEMKAVKPRKGGAEIKKMSPAKNQRRYFINGSVSLKSYSGTVKASATIKTDELRKPAMQQRARQWPKTRSAVDVAAFLKRK